MTPGDRRQDFNEPDFEQVSDAYRRLPGEEPPELLDQAVLNRARRAASSKTIRPWNFGWIHAVSTAAVLVLGIALVMNLPDSTPPEPSPGSRLGDDESSSTVETFRLMQEFTVDADAAEAIRAEKAASPAAGQQAAEPAVAAEERGLLAEPAAIGLGETERSGRGDDRVGTAAAAIAETQALEAAPEAQEAPVREPEAWLEHLLELRARGELAQFEAELAAFRQAWPDYPLPPEFTD
jgi:hypothetical protein